MTAVFAFSQHEKTPSTSQSAGSGQSNKLSGCNLRLCSHTNKIFEFKTHVNSNQRAFKRLTKGMEPYYSRAEGAKEPLRSSQ